MDAPRLLQPAPPAPTSAEGDHPARAPWGVLEILTALLVTFAALVGVTGMLMLLRTAGLVPRGKPEDEPAVAIVLVVAQVLLDLGGLAAAGLLSLGKYGLGLRAWGLRRERPLALRACAATLIASYLALALYARLVDVLGLKDLKPENNVPRALFEDPVVLPFTVLLVVIVAPITEEMFFRGFVFRGLLRRFGVPGAAVLSGLLFSAIHVTSADLIGVLIPFAIIGVLFAVLVARTGSLWNSILVHLSFNLTSTMLAVVGGEAGVVAGLGAVVALFLGLNAWLQATARPLGLSGGVR